MLSGEAGTRCSNCAGNARSSLPDLVETLGISKSASMRPSRRTVLRSVRVPHPRRTLGASSPTGAQWLAGRPTPADGQRSTTESSFQRPVVAAHRRWSRRHLRRDGRRGTGPWPSPPYQSRRSALLRYIRAERKPSEARSWRQSVPQARRQQVHRELRVAY
jgi:hypothetical protein